jgi:hypothetical protein
LHAIDLKHRACSFAQRAKLVKNRPQRNIFRSAAELEQIVAAQQRQIALLQVRIPSKPPIACIRPQLNGYSDVPSRDAAGEPVESFPKARLSTRGVRPMYDLAGLCLSRLNAPPCVMDRQASHQT